MARYDPFDRTAIPWIRDDVGGEGSRRCKEIAHEWEPVGYFSERVARMKHKYPQDNQSKMYLHRSSGEGIQDGTFFILSNSIERDADTSIAITTNAFIPCGKALFFCSKTNCEIYNLCLHREDVSMVQFQASVHPDYDSYDNILKYGHPVSIIATDGDLTGPLVLCDRELCISSEYSKEKRTAAVFIFVGGPEGTEIRLGDRVELMVGPGTYIGAEMGGFRKTPPRMISLDTTYPLYLT